MDKHLFRERKDGKIKGKVEKGRMMISAGTDYVSSFCICMF